MRSLSSLPVTWRLAIVVGIALLGFLALTTLSSLHTRGDVEALEKKRVQHLVESAGYILAHFHDQERAGALSRADAQARALAALRAVRYDEATRIIDTSFGRFSPGIADIARGFFEDRRVDAEPASDPQDRSWLTLPAVELRLLLERVSDHYRQDFDRL